MGYIGGSVPQPTYAGVVRSAGIVTLIEPAPVFYLAEEYHQRYYEKKGITHG